MNKPDQPWPPPWARSLAFMVGIGLMIYETVIDHAQNLVVYGPAFLLTGLPVARGVEALLDKLPWGVKAEPPPPLPPTPPAPPKSLPPAPPADDPLEGW